MKDSAPATFVSRTRASTTIRLAEGFWRSSGRKGIKAGLHLRANCGIVVGIGKANWPPGGTTASSSLYTLPHLRYFMNCDRMDDLERQETVPSLCERKGDESYQEK
jgi:hypothetical protein